MKKTYKLAIVGAGMLTLGLSGSALAFHGGGVAHCDGCHTMHNSADNPSINGVTAHLMKGTDASSTCLNCHSGAGGYHINSTDGSNMNSGGDFYWVANPYDTNVRGNTVTWGGDNAGHNIVAADFALEADPDNITAPGGTLTGSDFGCTSCHDAHGQVAGQTMNEQPISVSGSYTTAPAEGTIKGNYRILGGAGYIAGDHNRGDGYAFPADLTAPLAVANGSNGYQVRYESGMSEWCAACHDGLYTQATGGTEKHPTDLTLAGSTDGRDYVGIYNSYVATGNNTGDVATAYDALVPIERGATGIAGGPADPTGADNNSLVMCLSCHRAHASAFDNMGRWDFKTEFLAHSAVLSSADVPVTAVPYYADGAAVDIAATYGEYQRSLCNKCHGQD